MIQKNVLKSLASKQESQFFSVKRNFVRLVRVGSDWYPIPSEYEMDGLGP